LSGEPQAIHARSRERSASENETPEYDGGIVHERVSSSMTLAQSRTSPYVRSGHGPTPGA